METTAPNKPPPHLHFSAEPCCRRRTHPPCSTPTSHVAADAVPFPDRVDHPRRWRPPPRRAASSTPPPAASSRLRRRGTGGYSRLRRVSPARLLMILTSGGPTWGGSLHSFLPPASELRSQSPTKPLEMEEIPVPLLDEDQFLKGGRFEYPGFSSPACLSPVSPRLSTAHWNSLMEEKFADFTMIESPKHSKVAGLII